MVERKYRVWFTINILLQKFSSYLSRYNFSTPRRRRGVRKKGRNKTKEKEHNKHRRYDKVFFFQNFVSNQAKARTVHSLQKYFKI